MGAGGRSSAVTASAGAQQLEPLRALQRRLQGLYGLPYSIDVAEFVTTDATWARAMLGETERAIGECVFVRAQGATLDLGVYLDADLLGRLAAAEIGTRSAPGLFEAMTLRSGMDGVLPQRYADANRYAGRYCRYLQANYRACCSDRARLYEELHCFYRLPQPEKVRRVERRGV